MFVSIWEVIYLALFILQKVYLLNSLGTFMHLITLSFIYYNVSHVHYCSEDTYLCITKKYKMIE